VLILFFTMFLHEKQKSWLWQINLFLFLAIMLSSCGVPGSDSKVTTMKEKNMAAGNTNMAYKKEVAATKEVMPAKTEMATFALG
jgi:hypothetical protein